jgi:hypothetical protein
MLYPFELRSRGSKFSTSNAEAGAPSIQSGSPTENTVFHSIKLGSDSI